MQQQRVCIAGYLPDETCVRPIFRVGGIAEEWLKITEQAIIRPFAKIEFDLLENKHIPPHTEDWIIDPGYRVNRGLLTISEQKALLAKTEYPDVASIFETTVYQGPGWYIRSGEGKRSLGTIRAKRIFEVAYYPRDTDKWDYRIAFIDQNNEQYKLAVVDLAFRYLLDALRLCKKTPLDELGQRLTQVLQDKQVFIRIGLSRGWEKYPDRCYLQITGVYTFPDYLKGHCFSDISCSIDEFAEFFWREEDLPF